MPRDDGVDDGDEYARGSIKSRIWTFTLLMAATLALWVEFQVLFWRQNDLPQSVHHRMNFCLLFHIEAANFRAVCFAAQGSVALDTSASSLPPSICLPPSLSSFRKSDLLVPFEFRTPTQPHTCECRLFGPGFCCTRCVRMDSWRWRQTAVIKTFFGSFQWGGRDSVWK